MIFLSPSDLVSSFNCIDKISGIFIIPFMLLTRHCLEIFYPLYCCELLERAVSIFLRQPNHHSSIFSSIVCSSFSGSGTFF